MEKEKKKMEKRNTPNDFSKGKVWRIILAQAIPLTLASFVQLLYNVVDRVYIGHLRGTGGMALTGVGVTFPIVTFILALTMLFASGGSPLFSMARGAGDGKRAYRLQGNVVTLLVFTALTLTIAGEIFRKPILYLFGATSASYPFARAYFTVYLLGTLFNMFSTGMNFFINAQGYSMIGMTTVMIGAVANIILDPVMIFVLGLGVEGAAIATILSQALSAVFVLFFLFGNKVDYRLHCLRPDEIRSCGPRARRITGLGMAAFIMQLTNSLVTVSCNQVLSHVGGDIYVSIMTIINSARQMLETPLLSITEGTSPIISFNYGARRFKDVKEAGLVMFLLSMGYAGAVWMILRICPAAVIGIFSSDPELMETALPSFNLYFSTFIFMVFQHCGQIVFKSLGKKNHAIFFSLLRKAFIVIPLTYLLPYAFHMGTAGVFAAEPISNVVGGLACFITMLIVVLPELK